MTADQPNPTPDARRRGVRPPLGDRVRRPLRGARRRSWPTSTGRPGDGDFGTNLGSALRRARDFLDRRRPAGPSPTCSSPSPRASWTPAGPAGRCSACGSASSPRPPAASRSAPRRSPRASPTASPPSSGSAGAEVGDSTMVDALAPGAAALQAGSAAGVGVREALVAAAEAAAAGAESTRDAAGQPRPGELRRRGGPRRPRPRRGRRGPVLRGRHRRRHRWRPCRPRRPLTRVTVSHVNPGNRHVARETSWAECRFPGFTWETAALVAAAVSAAGGPAPRASRGRSSVSSPGCGRAPGSARARSRRPGG